MSIDVLTPGVFSTVQDLGRFGQFEKGFTQAGPLDLQQFNWVNRLLLNSASAAQIEIFYGGLVFRALSDIVICVGAEEGCVRINDIAHPLWQTLPVKTGQTVDIGYFSKGRVGYLGVVGGFDVGKIMGSASTVTREKVGGIDHGNPLKTGDVVACQSSIRSTHLGLPADFWKDESTTREIRVVIGYQHDDFSHVQQQRFFSSVYVVSDQFDRMGCRLDGPLIKPDKTDYFSEGIALGAVQITNQGQPIVLLNDRQTIGGYPKMGSVLSLDLRRLVQTQTGDKVRFCPISVEQAHNLLHLYASVDSRVVPLSV